MRIKLSFAALAAFAVFLSTSALTASGATTVAATGPTGQITRIGAVTPRLVAPTLMPGPSLGHAEADIDGETPRIFRPGHPTTGLPAVVADGAGAQAAAGPNAANGNFSNLLAFSGASWQNTGCGCEPPDTQMAAGRNEIVEAVNNNIFVFDRGGNQLGTFPATDLFQRNMGTVGVHLPEDPVRPDGRRQRDVLRDLHGVPGRRL